MKIRIPKQIKIGTHTYKVIYDRSIRTDDDRIGECNHRTQTIEIEPNLPPSRQDQTFLHEVGHLIRKVYVMQEDEDNIDRTAQGFADLLFNNLGIEFVWDDITEVNNGS